MYNYMICIYTYMYACINIIQLARVQINHKCKKKKIHVCIKWNRCTIKLNMQKSIYVNMNWHLTNIHIISNTCIYGTCTGIYALHCLSINYLWIYDKHNKRKKQLFLIFFPFPQVQCNTDRTRHPPICCKESWPAATIRGLLWSTWRDFL